MTQEERLQVQFFAIAVVTRTIAICPQPMKADYRSICIAMRPDAPDILLDSGSMGAIARGRLNAYALTLTGVAIDLGSTFNI